MTADGYKGAHKDPLISLGTAPLDDSLFRAAVFEQLGEPRLEAAVTTDVIGSEHSHAVRLDAEAIVDVRKARIHRKVATVVFFESNGGQHRGEATLPEVRLAVGEPAIDIGHVEQCLESLTDACYFLTAVKNRYRFSFRANLNKMLADRRASVSPTAIQERVLADIHKVFGAGSGVERIYCPEKSNQVPDRPALTLCVLHPDHSARVPATRALLTQLTAESGTSARTFKSALLWAVAEEGTPLTEEARKLLAWKDIEGDSSELKLDEAQHKLLLENVKRAERDLRETVWRSYKNVFLLAEDNMFRRIDLGLVHSSTASSLVELIITRLKQEDLVVEGVGPNFLTRYWPPALAEWSTKSVRDAFFASPKFPRLVKADAIRETISRGLDAGLFAYIGKTAGGQYEPFVYKRSLASNDVEISEDVFLISRERAEEYLRAREAGARPTGPTTASAAGPGPHNVAPVLTVPTVGATGAATTPARAPAGTLTGFTWSGMLPPQKWMNFYTRVLSRFATGDGMKLTITIDVAPTGGVPKSKIDETRVALRELGLSEIIQTADWGK